MVGKMLAKTSNLLRCGLALSELHGIVDVVCVALVDRVFGVVLTNVVALLCYLFCTVICFCSLLFAVAA